VSAIEPKVNGIGLARTLHRVTVVFALTTAVLLVAVVYAFATRNAPAPVFDPLGDFPTQQITSDQPIPAGNDVGVDGIKCSNATTTITIKGKRLWQLLRPAGTAIPVRGGQGPLKPGCTHQHYEDPMPSGVIARVNQLAAQGTHITTWIISGSNEPIPPGGERPVVKTYTSTAFRIIA
jgi:hypothetical protein